MVGNQLKTVHFQFTSWCGKAALDGIAENCSNPVGQQTRASKSRAKHCVIPTELVVVSTALLYSRRVVHPTVATFIIVSTFLDQHHSFPLWCYAVELRRSKISHIYILFLARFLTHNNAKSLFCALMYTYKPVNGQQQAAVGVETPVGVLASTLIMKRKTIFVLAL